MLCLQEGSYSGPMYPKAGWFVSDKDESKLALAMPIPIKARNPFLRIRKKMGPNLDLEVGKQSALKIMR